MLVSVLILVAIVSALAIVFAIGENTKSTSAAKVDLQAHVRQVIDVLARDVRQTISWDIGNNNPSPTHIKFRPVQEWNSTTDTLVLGNNYIEYTYNATSGTITRALLDASNNTIEQREFHNITVDPFYTIDLTNSTVVPLNEGDLLNSRRMVLTVTGQSQLRGGRTLTHTLSEEVKVRNE